MFGALSISNPSSEVGLGGSVDSQAPDETSEVRRQAAGVRPEPAPPSVTLRNFRMGHRVSHAVLRLGRGLGGAVLFQDCATSLV